MATATVSQAFTNNSDANFRLWGKWISDLLAAGGWTKTSDSGQINWATVTAPGSINTSAGYEVWSFADALQATAPVKLKIEYGCGGATTTPTIWLTIGDTSDGSGNILGNPLVRRAIAPNAHTTASSPYHGAAGTSWCAFSIVDQSTAGMTIVIERTKDASGADTAYGVNVATIFTNGFTHQNVYMLGVGPAVVETSLNLLLPSSGTLTKGGVVQLVSLFPYDGNYLNPFLGMMWGFAANLTVGTTVSYNMYGASHTYYVCNIGSTINRSGVSVVPLIRYE